MKTLVTKRLVLRDLRLTDLKAFYNYAKKPNIGPMAGWPPHKDIDQSRKILNMMIAEQEVWGITLKDDDSLIGTIGLHVRNLENALEDIREIGYVIDDTYWGKGLMVEAVKKVLAYGFVGLELKEITVGHSTQNTQSKRVIEKSGFIYTHDEIRKDSKGADITIHMYHITKKHYEELLEDDKFKTEV
ncbi:hypothetical protein BK011_01945 [Tenericutes bacterium MZ-XQ]|nr:hypothetical protein BK011_01945 [Tenericutes bacterium MZ-XQ]